MLDWSRLKFIAAVAFLAALPLGLFLLAHKALPALLPQAGGETILWLKAVAASLGFAGAMAGGWLWHQNLNNRVDQLIDHCHRLALGNPQSLGEIPGDLGRLGRLGLAIEVLREVLVDYLSLYRRFFEAAPDMFLSLSPAGKRILDANQAFCRKVGLLRSEVLGQMAESFVTLDKPWDAIPQQSGALVPGQVTTPQGAHKDRGQPLLGTGPPGPALDNRRHFAGCKPPRHLAPQAAAKIHRPGKGLGGDKKRGRVKRPVFDHPES